MKNIKVAFTLGALTASPLFTHAVAESSASSSNDAKTAYTNFQPHIKRPPEPLTDINGVTKDLLIDTYERNLIEAEALILSTTEEQTTLINDPDTGWRLRDETRVQGHIVSTTYSHAGQFWPTDDPESNDFMEFRRDLTQLHVGSEFHWNEDIDSHYEISLSPKNLHDNGVVFANPDNVIKRASPSCHVAGSLNVNWIGPAIDQGEGDNEKQRSNVGYMRKDFVHLVGMEEFNGTTAYVLSSNRTYDSKTPHHRNYEGRSFYLTFDDKGDDDPSNDEAQLIGRTSLYAKYIEITGPWQEGLHPDYWKDQGIEDFVVYSPYRAVYDTVETTNISDAQAWVRENWRTLIIDKEEAEPYVIPDFLPRRIYVLENDRRKEYPEYSISPNPDQSFRSESEILEPTAPQLNLNEPN